MDQDLITIKFVTDSKYGDKCYQTPKTVIKKYPNSILNFCRDFDNDTIEFNTDIINYDEFQLVLDVINGKMVYWCITNERIKHFIEVYGFINTTFESVTNLIVIKS